MSQSSFGSADTPIARKMREALRLIQERAPDLEAEGEMHADAALSKRILDQVFPDTRLTAESNRLVMPRFTLSLRDGAVIILCADHFGADSRDVACHVGTLGHHAQLLCRISDSAFQEGQHAT